MVTLYNDRHHAWVMRLFNQDLLSNSLNWTGGSFLAGHVSVLAMYGYEHEEIIALNQRTANLSEFIVNRIIICYYPFAASFRVIARLVKIQKPAWLQRYQSQKLTLIKPLLELKDQKYVLGTSKIEKARETFQLTKKSREWTHNKHHQSHSRT